VVQADSATSKNAGKGEIEMMTTIDVVGKILSDAMELPAKARAFVAEKLIESLDVSSGGELSPQWREEIRRRCKEIDEGVVELCEAESVFARACAALA
jgi:hypothetical protein